MPIPPGSPSPPPDFSEVIFNCIFPGGERKWRREGWVRDVSRHPPAYWGKLLRSSNSQSVCDPVSGGILPLTSPPSIVPPGSLPQADRLLLFSDLCSGTSFHPPQKLQPGFPTPFCSSSVDTASSDHDPKSCGVSKSLCLLGMASGPQCLNVFCKMALCLHTTCSSAFKPPPDDL